MFNRIRLELTAAAALALALAALLIAMRDASSPAETAERAAPPQNATAVRITKFTYNPDPIRVERGQAVAWTNRDLAPHTVTAEDNSWDSGLMDQGETFVLTFDEPGVYEYICALHPPRLGLQFAAPDGEKLAGGGGHGMRGSVIVE
jgi:plastocyanin